MPTILFIGLSATDPSITLPPSVSVSTLSAAIQKGADDLTGAGYTVNLFLPPLMGGIEALEGELGGSGVDQGERGRGGGGGGGTGKKYDLVLVGVGIRMLPQHTPYFEAVVNTCLKYNPGQRFAFNASLESTLEAAQRALPL